MHQLSVVKLLKFVLKEISFVLKNYQRISSFYVTNIIDSAVPIIDMEKDKAETSKTQKEKSKNKPSSSTSDEGEEESADGISMEAVRKFFAQKLNFYANQDDKEDHPKLLETVDFDGLMKQWKTKGFKKIVTLVGAGISTSAGIPDFRSPDTGLYHNLQKYNLPHPQAIFELDYFQDNPQPFFALARELYPGTFKPTPCHYFIKLLDDKGWLLRHYTQNIDTLERITGLRDEKIVEAHGTFYTNTCIQCRKKYDMKWMKEKIFSGNVPTCECMGIIKPDIVFFGENLPDKFYRHSEKDLKQCDLVIIMGTSLEVQPFASLPDQANKNSVRLLINKEKVGTRNVFQFLSGGGLNFDGPNNYRDIAWLGDCDEAVQLIADELGIGDELKDMIKKEHALIDNSNKVDEAVAADP